MNIASTPAVQAATAGAASASAPADAVHTSVELRVLKKALDAQEAAAAALLQSLPPPPPPPPVPQGMLGTRLDVYA